MYVIVNTLLEDYLSGVNKIKSSKLIITKTNYCVSGVDKIVQIKNDPSELIFNNLVKLRFM